MSIRRVGVVLVCEDSQQEAFTRRFLEGMGWSTREIRVEKSPSASGSAEQWVRERFPIELGVYRQRRHRAASALIAMIDADVRDVQDRIREFEDECNSLQIPFRGGDEAVAIAVPRRNIETWIKYLNDGDVDERNIYPKLGRERECNQAVLKLVRLCKSTGLPTNSPPALVHACGEYNTRIRPLVNQR